MPRFHKTLVTIILAFTLAGLLACHNVLLTNPVGTSATLVNAPFENSERAVNVLLFVDGPPFVLEHKKEHGKPFDDYTFYNWFFNAFAIFGNDIYLVTGSYVAKRAKELGMDTSGIYFGETFLADPGSIVSHLSFDDSDYQKLRGIAAELGVTHIIKAKLIDISTNDVDHAQYFTAFRKDYRFFERSSTTKVTGYMHRTMLELDVDVYDTTLGKTLYKKTYDFYEESLVISPFEGEYGHAKGSGTIREAVVDSILSDIDDRSRRMFRGANKDSKTYVDYPVEYKISGNQELDPLVLDLRPRIESIQRTDDDLRIVVNLFNPSSQKMTIVPTYTNGRLSTFIIDGQREVFWSGGHTMGNGTSLGPGRSVSATFSFPHKDGNLGNVNMQMPLLLHFGNKRSPMTFTFTELKTPNNIGELDY